MKKINLKMICSLSVIAVLVAITAVFRTEILSILSPETLTGAITALSAAGAAAVETVQGTVTVQDGKVVNKPTISQRLSLIRPSATPMDTILRELNSETTDSFEFRYYSVNSRAISTKIGTTSSLGAEGGAVELVLTSAHMLSIDGNIMVPSFNATSPMSEATATGNSLPSFSPLILHIVGIERSSNKVKVIALNASKVPVLTADTPIYRLGVAKHELSAKSEDPSAMPFKDSNFCQIHMTTIGEGIYQAMQEKEVKFGLLDIKEQALFDFRMTNEADALFGVKREFIDPESQKPKYTSDGMIRKITKKLDKGSASSVTEDVIMGWCSDIFDANNGSDTRILFYGNDMGLALAKSKSIQKQLEAKSTEVVYGVKFNKIETNWGTLLLKKHDSLSQYGYSGAGIVIDPTNISRVIQKPLESTVLELDRTGQERSNSVRLDECHTLAVYNPDTHAMLSSI